MNKILTNEKINNILFSEVLEHLENPRKILDTLYQVNFDKIIITVPNEPLWRILNMLRCKYVKNFGNTPGHINHFSIKSLKKILLSVGFKIEEIKVSQPFLLFSCTK